MPHHYPNRPVDKAPPNPTTRKVRGSRGYRTVVPLGAKRPLAPGHTVKIFGPVVFPDDKIVPVTDFKVLIKRVLANGRLLVDLGAYHDEFSDLQAEVDPEYVQRARMY